MLIPDFDNIVFVDGARFEGLADEVWTNRIRHVGELRFPSGKVLVADSLATSFEREVPLDHEVAEGPFDVFVAMAETSVDRRVSAAWVRLSENKVRSWAPAFYEGYEPDDTYVPGFGVDSGTACIADFDAARSVAGEAAGDRLLAAFGEADVGSDAPVLFHPDMPERFFACSSGLGDGFYSSFWGLDASGQPAVLLVDFDLLIVPIWESFDLEFPLKRGRIDAPVLEKTGATAWIPRLPLFGSPKLRVRDRVPRVRVLRGGERVDAVSRTFELSDALYSFDAVPGDILEVSFSVGHRCAKVLAQEV